MLHKNLFTENSLSLLKLHLSFVTKLKTSDVESMWINMVIIKLEDNK